MTSSVYGPTMHSSVYGPSTISRVSPTGMSVKQTFTEDTITQMKDIWRQLAQSLLQKENKIVWVQRPLFFSTPTVSKEPISRLARCECSKFNRLVLGEDEPLRTFSSRSRAELHAVRPSTSMDGRSQQYLHPSSSQLQPQLQLSSQGDIRSTSDGHRMY